MGNILIVEGIKVPIGSHKGKTIIIGSDHRGFEYKASITQVFSGKGYQVVDIGTRSPGRCDYPAISDAMGVQITGNLDRIGIGICGSGIGILIPASKHKGVYAARCSNPGEAETSRRHNNTNLLGIGADCVDLETALATVDAWLTTPFFSEGEKEEAYLRRYVQTVRLEATVRR